METPITLKKVVLGSHHLRPGRTVHEIVDKNGSRDFPPFVSLEIVQYPKCKGCYLIYLTAEGFATDVYFPADLRDDCVEAAMYQAEFEFNVQASEWLEVTRP